MDPPIASAAKCEIRSVIRFFHAKSMEPVNIHRELTTVYGENCMSVQQVRLWCREFSKGRTDVHDAERSGRPSISEAIVAKINEVVREDRRMTIEDIALRVPDVCPKSVYNILTEKLGYTKVCARWVPRMLTADHKQQRIDCSRAFLQQCDDNEEETLGSIVTGDETWCFHFTPETKEQSRQWRHSGSPAPKKFKVTQSAGKVMATVFWDQKGILLIDFMPPKTTINSDRYGETLKKLRRAIQNRRRGMLSAGVKLHHDNARPHTSRQTQDLITTYGWIVVPHPPYSPDLAPSDFHLFPKLKEHLSGMKFSSDEEVKTAVTDYLNGLAEEFFAAGYQNWIKRLKKCIDREGDYVEK